MAKDRRTEKGRSGVYSAQDVRQGEIILRTPARRIIFIAGLVAAVIVAVALRIAMHW